MLQAPAPRPLALLGLALAVALMAGCASRGGGRPERDGPEARPPPYLERVPDAEPRIEVQRSGGPNKPYEVLGQRYVPLVGDPEVNESGLASWYGRKFHGQPTSSGEPYDMYAMTAAHKTMPLPSYARVRNPANGREIIVRVNDRGPFAAGRVIDLSYTAALKLGLLAGVAPVQVQRITHAEIRSGSFRNGATVVAPSAPIVTAADDPAPGTPMIAGPGFWLQLGAFRLVDAAALLQQRALREVDGLPGVAVVEEGGWLRVQAGPFATRAEAQQALPRVRQFTGSDVLIVERR